MAVQTPTTESELGAKGAGESGTGAAPAAVLNAVNDALKPFGARVEKIDVNFRTETRKAVDISASELFSPYVKLSGTLAKPSVALDAQGTLLSGGAAYLTGGLSILAKKALDQLGSTQDPCTDILSESTQ